LLEHHQWVALPVLSGIFLFLGFGEIAYLKTNKSVTRQNNIFFSLKNLTWLKLGNFCPVSIPANNTTTGIALPS